MNEETKRAQDRELVRRMVDGDEVAFERFADEWIPRLYRYALFRLDKDPELTADIVQSTVCKVIAKLESFRGEAALMTWLCACCRNEIAMHFRRSKGRFREVDQEVDTDALVDGSELWSSGASLAGPEAGLLFKEQSELVHLALDELPDHYGRALEWKYLEDLPVVEIARRLEVGPKAAESLLTRARAAFRTGYRRLLDSARIAGSTRATLEG